jgi:diguanylate cyclase (GGDEF)-like protein
LATETHRRARRLAWVVGLVACAVGAAFIRIVEQRRAEAERRDAMDAARAFSRRLEAGLDDALSTAEVLASVLRRTGRMDGVAALAAELRLAKPRVLSLQLAPNGKVAWVDPSGAGEVALGRDLLRKEDRLERIAAAVMATKRAVLTGRTEGQPFLLGLLPVYLPDTSGKNDDPFWGFVTVAIDKRRLLDDAGAQDFVVTRGYDYELLSSSPASQSREFLDQSTFKGLEDAVTVDIPVPAVSCTLAVAPRAGWRSASTLPTEVALVLVAALVAALAAHRLAREPDTLRQEVEVRRRRLSEANRQIHTEVSQRLEAVERLRHDAAHDSLTSLPNRASLTALVQAALDFARDRPELRTAVLLLDLDRFKYVNDSLGHSAGDRLLIAIAGRLQGCLRPGDTIARVGGDEFAILLCDAGSLEKVTGVAERLLRAMGLPFDLGGHEAFSTLSIGVALGAPGHSRAEELLRDADTAMHRAKSQGRARYVCFDEGMRTRVVTLLQLETDLRRALEREEFEVHYQPIVSLASGAVAGFEALVRWNHPVRGLVNPMEFMPLAEETGLVIWIDRWVLGAAAAWLRDAQWRFAGATSLFVSVNFSGRQLAQPRLVEFVGQTLEVVGLPASNLKIEITESVLMENAEAALEVLRRLGEMGVRVSIDDFGTGYSSLGYLDRFPFHLVKIDQSFIRDQADGDKGSEIVRTIVELTRTLGMEVIAEGVETPQQLARLREVACTFGQGYLFSKPLDAAGAEHLIASDPRW